MDTLSNSILKDLPPIGSQRKKSDPLIYFQIYISRMGGIFMEPIIEPQELFIWFVLEGEKRGEDYLLYAYNFLECKFEEVLLSELEEFSKSLHRSLQIEEDKDIHLPLFRSILEHITTMLMRSNILSLREANRYCQFLNIDPVPKDIVYSWESKTDAYWKYGSSMVNNIRNDEKGMGVNQKELIEYLKDKLGLQPNGSINGANFYRSYALSLRDKILEINKLPSVMEYYSTHKVV